MRYEVWDQKTAQETVFKRFEEARKYQEQFERSWIANEQVLFTASGNAGGESISYSFEALQELFAGDQNSGDSWVSMNYAFKYIRFLHAQLSANPPAVIPKPTSSDYNDRMAAKAADRLGHYIRRHYKLQDRIDLLCLQTLTYGSGFFKTQWDPNAGEILEVDREAQELTMTGDMHLRPLQIWDVLLDPVAQHWDEMRYVFERHVISAEEAKWRFPDKGELIEKYVDREIRRSTFWDRDQDGNKPKERVEVWEYVEKGLPWNGMAGRRMFILNDGTSLSNVAPNPNPNACLPYHILTDIDVPGQVYGRTFVDYIIRLQDVLNRLDSTVLDNIQAHGTVRMVLYNGAEVQEDLPSNSAWKVIHVDGVANEQPTFVSPPTLMPDIYRFRDQLLSAMEQLAGVNDSMFGQVKREMSGFSLQTAINAGNMVRKRLFNKYRDCMESIYRQVFGLIKDKWTDPRKVLVVGEENALEVAYYSGADVKDGFDFDTEYGTSLPIDPDARREAVMQMVGYLKEAGYTMKQILSLMRLNGIGEMFDMAEAAKRRQMEIFDQIISKYEEDGIEIYIAPRELEEHQGMLSAAYEFVMSQAYNVLDEELKMLIDQHIKEREQLAAQGAAPGAGPTGDLAQAGPMPGAPAPAGPAEAPGAVAPPAGPGGMMG